MATMTFANLKTAITTLYDLPTPTASTTWLTTSQINSLTNLALRRYYALLSECAVDHYNELQTTITALANTLDTAVPTRFHRLGSLVWQRGTDDLVQLEPARPEDDYLVGYTAVDWAGFMTPRFKLFGSNIRWLPKSISNQTVYITYSATPGDLSADGDTFEAGSGWEAFVIYDVCAMIATREEKSAGDWIGMREEARQTILQQAPLRGDTKQGLFLDNGMDASSDWDIRNRITLSGF
jgi:hypothetical protein